MANTTTNTNKSGSFLDDLLLNGQIAWKLYTDPRVSMLLKVAVPVVALLYFLMPVDLLPDFIPFLGQLDEVAIALLLIRMFVALAPTDIVAEYRNKATGGAGPQASTAGKTSSNSTSQKASSNGAQPNYDDVVDAEYRVVNDD
ncbi:MAG: YkvA family protein [Caldilineales bacterium]